MPRRMGNGDYQKSPAHSDPGLLSLPAEVSEQILSYLTIHEWHRLRLVSTKCRDIIDHSRVWHRMCVDLVKVPETSSDIWELLRIRNVSSLGITDHKDYPSVNGFQDVTSKLTSISRLTVHSFRGDVNELLLQLACLKQLEHLSVGTARGCSLLTGPDRFAAKSIDVDDSLADMLYSMPNLTDLRLVRIVLKSGSDVSPFDPRACSKRLGISPEKRLALKKVDFELVATHAKERLLKESDLRLLPELQGLSYTVTLGECLGGSMCNIDMRDFTLDSAQTRHANLHELNVEFGPGVIFSQKKCLDWLSRIPPNVTVFSLGGCYFRNASRVLSSLGSSHGSTLTVLKLNYLFAVSGRNLNFISRTFVNLRSLLCFLQEDVLAANILKLGLLPHFSRLELLSWMPNVPDDVLTVARTKMKREFSIERVDLPY